MKVHRVRVRAAVDESDAQPVALRAANGWAGDAPVVGPRREEYARRNFHFPVCGINGVFAQHLSAGQRADLPVIPVHQDLHRVETIALVIDRSDEQAVMRGMVAGHRMIALRRHLVLGVSLWALRRLSG